MVYYQFTNKSTAIELRGVIKIYTKFVLIYSIPKRKYITIAGTSPQNVTVIYTIYVTALHKLVRAYNNPSTNQLRGA